MLFLHQFHLYRHPLFAHGTDAGQSLQFALKVLAFSVYFSGSFCVVNFRTPKNREMVIENLAVQVSKKLERSNHSEINSFKFKKRRWHVIKSEQIESL